MLSGFLWVLRIIKNIFTKQQPLSGNKVCSATPNPDFAVKYTLRLCLVSFFLSNSLLLPSDRLINTLRAIFRFNDRLATSSRQKEKFPGPSQPLVGFQNIFVAERK